MLSRLLSVFRRNADVGCADTRNIASDYLDEDVEPDLRRRVRDHLEKCGPCVSFLNTLRATVGLLRNLESTPAPPQFADRVSSKLRDAEEG